VAAGLFILLSSTDHLSASPSSAVKILQHPFQEIAFSSARASRTAVHLI
jgi:hypothetical protein